VTRTDQARQLAEQHRLQQVAIKAGFLAQFLPTWSLLDWRRLDETTPAWVRVVMAILRPWRQASANAAAAHYAEYRLLTAPRPLDSGPTLRFTGGVNPLGAVPLPDIRHTISVPVTLHIDWTNADKAAEHSLRVTGPGELKRQAAMGRTEEQAKDRGLVTVSGSASRQVLNGGRQATLTSVAADQQAIGWARLTDGNPCAFCALLAGRGPVYKSEQSAGFQAHDHCACIPVAVFSKAAPWPGNARAYRRLYNDSTSGYSGKDARNAFRRAYEQQQREAATPAQPQTA
jgi:hypothetical protein